MSDFTASASLDWGWIEFVGLWLLFPVAFILASVVAIGRWRGRRYK